MVEKNRIDSGQAIGGTEINPGEDRRVVVRMQDGQLIKGVLQWRSEPDRAVSLPPLPSVLHIQGEGGHSSSIRVSDSVAVFFVRTHQGEREYEEVKFSSGKAPAELWVQVRLGNGELLEGSTSNDFNLISAPGLWLWPSDKLCNNTLVYVTKSAAIDFHVLAVGT